MSYHAGTGYGTQMIWRLSFQLPQQQQQQIIIIIVVVVIVIIAAAAVMEEEKLTKEKLKRHRRSLRFTSPV